MHPNRHSAKSGRNLSLSKNKLRSRGAAKFHQTSPLETCGELFSDGKCIELIGDSETGQFHLLAFDGERQTAGACIEVGGQMYVPAELHPSVLRAVTLPANCREYESTTKLFTAIQESLINNGIPEEFALPLIYFVFATWFTDCLPAAPCLVITGPRPEAWLVLRLLACLVRHALPLIEMSMASFRSAPMLLQPTFLIDHEIRPSMVRLLIAANSRNAQLPSKGGVMNVYSAKAVYRGMTNNDSSISDGELQMNLLPSRGKLPLLDVRTETVIKNQFQPMLLMYRTRNITRVRNSEFDLPEFASGMRILARVLGAPIVDAPDLQAGLRALLQGQQKKIRAQQWLDKRCVVIEAVLALCHSGREGRVYVGDIAAIATKILEGRGESEPLKSKAVGAMLR
jgi:hypothetical protein